MNEAKPWHEDDDFWQMTAPMMFPERQWAAAPGEVESVIALLGVEPGAAVLDLCCGPGRHSLELARRGFRVTGVDRTASHLREARRRADAEGLSIEFVQEDMRLFCRPEAFDGAVNLWTSFGYFEDPEEDSRVLVNLHRSLKQSGNLVMDLKGKEIMARIFRERDWHEEDGVIMMEERKISRDWTWIENRWIMLKGGDREEFRVSHRAYSAAELRAVLIESGFKTVDIFGDWAEAPYDHEAKRLVAVAHK